LQNHNKWKEELFSEGLCFECYFVHLVW